jgi:hypothetical protein
LFVAYVLLQFAWLPTVEREIAAVIARYPVDRYEPFLWYIPPYIDGGSKFNRGKPRGMDPRPPITGRLSI